MILWLVFLLFVYFAYPDSVQLSFVDWFAHLITQTSCLSYTHAVSGASEFTVRRCPIQNFLIFRRICLSTWPVHASVPLSLCDLWYKLVEYNCQWDLVTNPHQRLTNPNYFAYDKQATLQANQQANKPLHYTDDQTAHQTPTGHRPGSIYHVVEVHRRVTFHYNR